MDLTGDEINILALSIAKWLNCNYNKEDIKIIRTLLSLIISNLNTYYLV